MCSLYLMNMRELVSIAAFEIIASHRYHYAARSEAVEFKIALKIHFRLTPSPKQNFSNQPHGGLGSGMGEATGEDAWLHPKCPTGMRRHDHDVNRHFHFRPVPISIATVTSFSLVTTGLSPFLSIARLLPLNGVRGEP